MKKIVSKNLGKRGTSAYATRIPKVRFERSNRSRQRGEVLAAKNRDGNTGGSNKPVVVSKSKAMAWEVRGKNGRVVYDM